MCEEAVDDCLAALKFNPDWFVTSKMLDQFDNALHANNDILFFNEDFDIATFTANQRHVFAVDLDKTNVDEDNDFNEDYPVTTIHVRPLAWCSKFAKHLKQDK